MTLTGDFADHIEKVKEIADSKYAAARYIELSEAILELWVFAKRRTPTKDQKEGFRLLALHRQGAQGEPSFNACRETCREIVYRYNLALTTESKEASEKAVRSMTHLVLHLYYFVSGKLEVEGLGEFCCSAKPLRAGMNETA